MVYCAFLQFADFRSGRRSILIKDVPAMNLLFRDDRGHLSTCHYLCSGNLFKSSPIVLTERIPHSTQWYVICSRVPLRVAVYPCTIFESINGCLRKITRRKSPHFQTFSSMKTTFSSALKTEHYLPRILKRFLCSNAAIFKETISQR